MTHTSKQIIFFGTEQFSLSALSSLIQAGYTVAAVVTKPDTLRGRGHTLTAPAVKVLAEEYSVPVWQPEKLSEIRTKVRELGEVAGVLVSYGKIIPQSIIDLFTPGIINLHPSLLPLYRGPTPIESAIAHRDTRTGVSLMQLSARMDAGPVYVQTTYPLDGTETQPILYERLADIGSAMLLDTLPRILDGTLQPTPQNDAQATYCSLLGKADSLLDPRTVSANTAEARIRAHLTFPRTRLTVFGHQIIITKAHVTTQQKTPLDLQCQDGVFLSIDELVAPSGKTMSAEAFLRGHAA